jgi:hypothetical protein
MFGVGDIKVVVELLENGLKMWKGHKEKRAKLYDEIYGPLFEKLEPIVQTYLKILNDARADLEKKPSIPLSKIREKITERRADIVIARNSILGVASLDDEMQMPTFAQRQMSSHNVEDAIAELMRAVRDLFEAPAGRNLPNVPLNPRGESWLNPGSRAASLTSKIRFLEQSKPRPPLNPVTGLASQMRHVEEQAKQQQRRAREDLTRYAELLITDFELAWQKVAKANHKLRLVLKD